MNYVILGGRIKNIRENELKLTQEELADLIGISVNTVGRIEKATTPVNNIEIYLKICEISGHTLAELLDEKDNSIHSQRIKRKINFVLNGLSEEELDYIYSNVYKFSKFMHKDQIRTLEDIKHEAKNAQKEEIH